MKRALIFGAGLLLAGNVLAQAPPTGIPIVPQSEVGSGSVGPDSVGTSELDDGADVPAAGELVRVATGATAFEYIAASLLSIDWTQLLNIPADLADGDDDNQTAVQVPITDAGTFFTGIEVETALQEIGPTMTDSRTPTAHRDSHETGGSDPLVDLAGETITTGTVADARIASTIARDSELHAEDHATRHSLGGADVVTVTNLASGCTDVEVLGGTAAGTGVECQAAGGGSGDVVGPASSTNNAIPTFGDTTGKLIQNSTATWDGVQLSLPNTAGPELVIGGTATISRVSGGKSTICGNAGCITLDTNVIDLGGNRLALSGTGSNPALAQSGTLVDFIQGSGGGTSGVRAGYFVAAPSAQTCTDSGDANPGALTVTVSGVSYVALTNADANSCTVTLSETGATNGQRLEIVIVSNAGGTVDFADTAGVSELAGAFSAGAFDALTLRYTVDRWSEISRSDN